MTMHRTNCRLSSSMLSSKLEGSESCWQSMLLLHMVTSLPPQLVVHGKLKCEQSDGKSFEKELDSATCSQVSVSQSISQQMRKESMPQETSGQTRETGPYRLSVSPAIRCTSCGTWGASSREVRRNPRQDQRRDSILSTDAKLHHMLREYESLAILY